jgi:hypothetical protein
MQWYVILLVIYWHSVHTTNAGEIAKFDSH